MGSNILLKMSFSSNAIHQKRGVAHCFAGDLTKRTENQETLFSRIDCGCIGMTNTAMVVKLRGLWLPSACTFEAN